MIDGMIAESYCAGGGALLWRGSNGLWCGNKGMDALFILLLL